MALRDYLLFQNEIVLALGVFLVVFFVLYYVFMKGSFHIQKNIALVVSVVVGLLAGWFSYREQFFGYEGVFGVVIYLFVAVVLIRALLMLLRGGRR